MLESASSVYARACVASPSAPVDGHRVLDNLERIEVVGHAERHRFASPTDSLR